MSAVLFLGFKVVSATDFELIENEKKSRYIWFVEDDSDKGENKIYLGEKLYGKVYNDKDIKVKISNLINSVGLKEDGTIDESLNYGTIIEWLEKLESNNESLRDKLEEEKEKLRRIDCVSTDKDAVWLIDYWCGKDVRGLLKMPFSRHWIMHIEAMQRIKNKLCKQCKQ